MSGWVGLSRRGVVACGAMPNALLILFATAEQKVLGTAMLGTMGTILVSAVSPAAIPEAQQ